MPFLDKEEDLFFYAGQLLEFMIEGFVQTYELRSRELEAITEEAFTKILQQNV